MKVLQLGLALTRFTQITQNHEIFQAIPVPVYTNFLAFVAYFNVVVGMLIEPHVLIQNMLFICMIQGPISKSGSKPDVQDVWQPI